MLKRDVLFRRVVFVLCAGFVCAAMSAAPGSAGAAGKVKKARAAMSDEEFVLLCGSGTAEQVREALRKGARINALYRPYDSERDMTPLMSAAAEDNLPAARVLLDAGARVNAKTPWGLTALMYAARDGVRAAQNRPDREADGGAAMVRALLEAGADANAKDDGGFTALMFAARDGGPELIRALLEAGADPNAATTGYPPGLTALMHAAMDNEDAEAVKLLAAAGADPNARDGEGLTALMWGAGMKWSYSHRRGEVLAALLEAGADRSLTDKAGRDALWHARNEAEKRCAQSRDEAAARCLAERDRVIRLLEGGADKNLESSAE